MASNSTSEYKVIADRIVSPDEDIIVSITGDIYKGSINEINRYTTVGDINEIGDFPVIPVTSEVYLDYLRADSYTENGTRERPYKTLAAALTKANTLSPSGTNPIRIVMVSGNTSATAETVTVTSGHIFILGSNSSGTHAPILWYGQITFNGSAGDISSNHFSLAGLAIQAVSGTTAITFAGTNPQRLFMKDVWLTGNGSADAMQMTNTGTGSTVHGNDLKFSHNGSGHYHCINVLAGTANLDSIETSGALTGVFGVHGSLNLSNSEIDSSGSYGIDVYAGGTLSAANCKITTSAANSYGVKLGEATAVAVLGNIYFTVPTAGTARAVYGVASTALYYSALTFAPGGNAKISSAITSTAIGSTPSFVA
jgi:hypothetical protein